MAKPSDSAAGAKRRAASSADDEPFDVRLERLEALVHELEEGGGGLEQAIERYQEGIALLKGCHETLQGYRARVEELGREAEDVLTPLADDPDFAGSDT